MFGRKAVIPVDLDNGSKHAQHDAEEVFGQGCDPETIQKMQEDTKKRMVYDCKHHQPDVYAVDALVLKKDFTIKKGKLDSKWVGPYKIEKVLEKGLYRQDAIFFFFL